MVAFKDLCGRQPLLQGAETAKCRAHSYNLERIRSVENALYRFQFGDDCLK